jgi:hypothetical protein
MFLGKRREGATERAREEREYKKQEERKTRKTLNSAENKGESTLNLLILTYTRIFQQQEELHRLKLL